MQNSKQEIVLYTGPKGAEKVEVHMDKDTVWLTQTQIAQLFDTDRSSITRHVKNVLNSAELSEISNVQFLHILRLMVKHIKSRFIISMQSSPLATT